MNIKKTVAKILAVALVVSSLPQKTFAIDLSDISFGGFESGAMSLSPGDWSGDVPEYPGDDEPDDPGEDEPEFSTHYYDDESLEIEKYNGNSPKVVIPDVIDGKKVVRIGESAFAWHREITSVVIPDSIKEIGYKAFFNCSSLMSVSIPSTVEDIGNGAFGFIEKYEPYGDYGEGFYSGVKIPGFSLKYKENTAGHFYALQHNFTSTPCFLTERLADGSLKIIKGYTNNKSIIIPSHLDGYPVVAIGENAFEWSGGNEYDSSYFEDTFLSGTNAFLENVIISEGIERIEDFAFYGLKSIELPDTIKSIGRQAFEGSDFLKGQGECKYVGNWLVSCYSGITTATIKQGTVGIADGVFQGCELLKKVVLPDEMRYIGKYAFASCDQLNSISIPKRVTDIGEYAIGYNYDYKTDEYIKDADVKIGCYKNSKGEQYAKDNNLAYELLDKPALAKVGGFKVKTKGSTSITLQWNKNSSASGYEIQQYKSGKWLKIGTVGKNSIVTYTIKGLKAGTAGYQFRVRAYKTVGNSKVYSDYSSTLKVNTNPYGVGGFKCSSKSSTSVTLKWNKGTTASGYQLQQYKNGKWVTIYTGTKATNTSYTVKNLKAGTAGYKFRIRAYKTYGSTKQYGSWSSEVKVNTNPYGVGGFKCSSKSSTSVTLKWNKGTTASGYQLQQYKNGKWVTIYTGTKVTNTSYTVKKLKAGTAGYIFRIRAYKTYGNTKQYGSWSSEVKVNTNPYGVSGFKAKSTAKTSITLGWNKGTTASGYQLQQYKNGKWVTIYTGTKATNTSYTVKNLKAGTAGYKFRIRAYKTYGKTKQYGSWSKVVKVNTNPYGVGGFKAKATAKTAVKLGWNKGTTASGYQLQQYKNGKWVTVYTGTKATSTSYTVKSLKANTSYKFRIRAYKTCGSTKQYSSWSKTLTVKTKK